MLESKVMCMCVFRAVRVSMFALWEHCSQLEEESVKRICTQRAGPPLTLWESSALLTDHRDAGNAGDYMECYESDAS